MKGFFTMILLLVLMTSCDKQLSRVDYFGEKPPENTPKVFATDVISLPDRWEGNANFSPDGREFYFNVFEDTAKTIYRSVLTEGKWTKPRQMSELEGQNTWEPFIDWNGQRLYFVSDRAPGSPEWNGRIWYMDRKAKGEWNKPEYFEIPFSPKGGLWFPNRSNRNNLYFGGTLADEDTLGMGDMYVLNLDSNELRLLAELCSPQEDWDPFAAPDGSYILWASDRPGGYGGTDLYVSFRNFENNVWGDPINLGEDINTEHYEVAPRITPDGKYLFFDRPIKGTQDIYWVSTNSILNKHRDGDENRGDSH